MWIKMAFNWSLKWQALTFGSKKNDKKEIYKIK
jgi:hypothetical protein